MYRLGRVSNRALKGALTMKTTLSTKWAPTMKKALIAKAPTAKRVPTAKRIPTAKRTQSMILTNTNKLNLVTKRRSTPIMKRKILAVMTYMGRNVRILATLIHRATCGRAEKSPH